MGEIHIIEGDLLCSPVEVIVNAWNRNIIPWWLLWPQGVSGAIKKRAGFLPFQELAKTGSLPLGQARLTSAGKLPFKGIIHVAGINMFWFATEFSISESVRSVIKIANEKGFRSVAFPMIGAGTGGFNPEKVKMIILDTLKECETDAEIYLVMYKKECAPEII